MPEPQRSALQEAYPLLRFFTFSHLKEPLQSISRPFCDLAYEVAARVPNGDSWSAPETAVAIRKLLEAKDAAVRATL